MQGDPSLWAVALNTWDIRRRPQLGRGALRRFQEQRLRQLIAHAYDRVPYYRELFDRHGLAPERVRTLADLERVPITTRRTLQALPLEQIVARGFDPKKLSAHTTSGSSGRPITIRRSRREGWLLDAVRRRAMIGYGLRRGDVKAVIKTPDGMPQPRWRQELRLRVRGTINQLVDCHLPLPEVVARLRELRPAIVECYPGVLARIARDIDPAELRALRLRFITTAGEVLTPAMREQATAAFGVPVFDVYASWEFNLLAWECPQRGAYHVSDDAVILEVLRDGRPAAPGERGVVVGTALHSFAMPLIRYEQGDLVTRGAEGCLCGAPFSTISEIQGRMIDHFPLPDGRVVHPYRLTTPIRDACPWIRELQAIQLAPDRLVMKLVAHPHPSPDELDRVRALAAAQLGPAVRFQVEVVPEIPLEASGKFRPYRSSVYSDYAGIALRR
jgi:phenylacetate-CoA ligase